MSNQKKFGVWMDSHHAAVVETKELSEGGPFIVAHIKGEETGSNSNEKTGNQHQQTVQQKFFKEIGSYLTNATYVHVTGTGQAQEQFIHYLKDTPQFKNTTTEESTSNKMSDEKLLEFIAAKLN